MCFRQEKSAKAVAPWVVFAWVCCSLVENRGISNSSWKVLGESTLPYRRRGFTATSTGGFVSPLHSLHVVKVEEKSRFCFEKACSSRPAVKKCMFSKSSVNLKGTLCVAAKRKAFVEAHDPREASTKTKASPLSSTASSVTCDDVTQDTSLSSTVAKPSTKSTGRIFKRRNQQPVLQDEPRLDASDTTMTKASRATQPYDRPTLHGRLVRSIRNAALVTSTVVNASATLDYVHSFSDMTTTTDAHTQSTAVVTPQDIQVGAWNSPKELFSSDTTNANAAQVLPDEKSCHQTTSPWDAPHQDFQVESRSSFGITVPTTELTKTISHSNPAPTTGWWSLWDQYKGTAAAPAFLPRSPWQLATTHNSRASRFYAHGTLNRNDYQANILDNEHADLSRQEEGLSPGTVLVDARPTALNTTETLHLLQSKHHYGSKRNANTMRKRHSRQRFATSRITGPEATTNTTASVDQQTRTLLKDLVMVRIAVPNQSEDLAIAELRLSVFANYSEDYLRRNRFRQRSREVLNARRKRGAICLVATAPRNVLLSTMKEQDCIYSWDKEKVVVGTAECSVHEFYGTRLGESRLASKIIYITEVAVSPYARWCGVGTKLLKAVDKLANAKGVETIYLHVDVANPVAASLYTKAGFRRVDPHPFHEEFTRSLNLHDGATKGRCHYLLCKDLQEPVILPTKPVPPKAKLGF